MEKGSPGTFALEKSYTKTSAHSKLCHFLVKQEVDEVAALREELVARLLKPHRRALAGARVDGAVPLAAALVPIRNVPIGYFVKLATPERSSPETFALGKELPSNFCIGKIVTLKLLHWDKSCRETFALEKEFP